MVRVDTVFFLGEDGIERHYLPENQRTYIIDGGHPHGLENRSDDAKYTLCIGTPWRGTNSRYGELLDTASCISIPRPSVKNEWFSPKYRVGIKNEGGASRAGNPGFSSASPPDLPV